jgi:hypothetical protein
MFACSFWRRAWFSPGLEEVALMALRGGLTATTGNHDFQATWERLASRLTGVESEIRAVSLLRKGLWANPTWPDAL